MNAKIVTFARTFKSLELPHVASFLASHSWCDTIYIGTCQTDPETIDIAKQFSNVQFKEFDGVLTLPDGEQIAHEGQYYQFLSSWCVEETARGNIDVALYDDFDHVPSPALQRDARRLIEESNAPFFYSLLLYVWGTEMYFPELNKCCPMERLWGWNVHKWTPDINPDHPFTVEIRNQPDRDIENGFTFAHPPYALLHYSYLNEETVRAKMAFNARRGVAQMYPLESCGHLEPIPSWARPKQIIPLSYAIGDTITDIHAQVFWDKDYDYVLIMVEGQEWLCGMVDGVSGKSKVEYGVTPDYGKTHWRLRQTEPEKGDWGWALERVE